MSVWERKAPAAVLPKNPLHEDAVADAKQEAPKSAEEQERDRIVQDNKRKQDEYETKLKDGEKRVKELNDRFADWYYVISGKDFQDLRLGRPATAPQALPPPQPTPSPETPPC